MQHRSNERWAGLAALGILVLLFGAVLYGLHSGALVSKPACLEGHVWPPERFHTRPCT